MRILILVPCYKRPEYTKKCIKALEEAQEYSDNVRFMLIDDGSNDDTEKTLKDSNLTKIVRINPLNTGLRNVLMYFIETAKNHEADLIGVIGNDCLVPKNWLNDILDIFEKTNVEVLSPNCLPSNPAFTHGKDDTEGLGYRPSKIVGGLWFMPTSLVKDMKFEEHDVGGICAAFNILHQILMEKDPVVGWAEKITIQDIGHWSGRHPDHIKTEDHAKYYKEVGRGVAW